MSTPYPLDIKLLQKSRQLEVHFSDGAHFQYSCVHLRRHSPAADNQHSEYAVIDEAVNIVSIVPVGHYAIRLCFSDGHDSGIYSWDLLYSLGNKVTN